MHREQITVRGRAEPEILDVHETRNGPLLDSYMVGIAEPTVVPGGIRHPYSLRWVGATEGIGPGTVRDMNVARDWETFRAAVRAWRCPGQNMVYADVDGNIGYQLTGAIPVRRGGDGSLPMPGWTSSYGWDGEVPFDELPRAFNPPDGFIVTANNRMTDASYPHHLGSDFLPPFRARRITSMLTATAVHDRDSFARIQVDTVSLAASAIVGHLVGIEPEEERQKQALALLAEWDHDLRADSAAAALYEVWNVKIAGRVLRPLLGEELFTHFYARRQWTNGFQYHVLPHLLAYPTARWFGEDGRATRDVVLLAALDEALDELTSQLGGDMDAWRWGALHTATFAGRLAIIPDLAELFTAGVVEMGGDEQTVNQSLFEPGHGYQVQVVPSWRQILDVSNWDESVGTITVGQSGNVASPHFDDQLELWKSGAHHPMPFTRPAVEEAAESTLTLSPMESS